MPRSQPGPLHPQYKGDGATVESGRSAANRAYVSLGLCEECGSKPATERHHIDGVTTHNGRDNLAFLCAKCHHRVHLRTHCKRGHEWTPENTRVTPQGWRECRACHRENERKRRDRSVN